MLTQTTFNRVLFKIRALDLYKHYKIISLFRKREEIQTFKH